MHLRNPVEALPMILAIKNSVSTLPRFTVKHTELNDGVGRHGQNHPQGQTRREQPMEISESLEDAAHPKSDSSPDLRRWREELRINYKE